MECGGDLLRWRSEKWRAEHSEYLRGADIVLVPDNDDAGWEHINQVGTALKGIAGRVRVLVLPDLRPKGDIVNWASNGGTREQLDAFFRAIAGVAAAA